MPRTRTSLSDPLRIDAVPAPGGGLIGMTICPGKVQRGSVDGGDWDRSLGLDLDRIRDWGAAAVVTLMEQHELDDYHVPGLGAAVRARGMAWHHLPIHDAGVPDASFCQEWDGVGAELRRRLAAGGKVALHCRGGLGRTGTIAAQLLVELGTPADAAIAQVRAARGGGAIENEHQEAYVRTIRPLRATRRGAARPAIPDAVRDRARGALLGLAVGDALGTTIEFKPRDTYPKQTEVTGGGPFNLAPGQWTDDTSMALALADSLLAHPGLDAADLIGRFVRWWREGAYSCTGHCFDIGSTTREALGRFERTGDPFAGATGEHTAGNGSLMRLAPAVLAALHDAGEVRRIAMEQSRTTHGAAQAMEACAWFAELLRRAVAGEPKTALLAPGTWAGHPAVQAVAAGTWRGRSRPGISSSGYVIHTLEAALWAVEQTAGFEDALVLAVNLGDDADTVGAVAGQLAGALYGLAGIPDRWLAPLAWRDRITDMADALLGGGAG